MQVGEKKLTDPLIINDVIFNFLTENNEVFFWRGGVGGRLSRQLSPGAVSVDVRPRCSGFDTAKMD